MESERAYGRICQNVTNLFEFFYNFFLFVSPDSNDVKTLRNLKCFPQLSEVINKTFNNIQKKIPTTPDIENCYKT